MSAEIIELHPRPFDPVRVEVTSPGTLKDGRRFYTVDYAEADGGGSTMWGGADLAEARKVAREIGVDDGLPVLDLTGVEPVEIPTGAIH